ncbi:D-alanyl-D-alanine carboxypeptidase [Accumulibacter sp.]|uniref:D-alanyl-D-alanine carboxypeptidase n=1 Tax=Accumulibacter sp. TaxID=2053492 RepID=UPI00258F2B4B|nr:D-alanyl-D-alanine carboxypeptidase [Accumulibacter sp.]
MPALSTHRKPRHNGLSTRAPNFATPPLPAPPPFVFLLCGPAVVAAEGLPPPVLSALKSVQIPANSVAVVVHSVDSHFTLVSHNARQAMNPASVMKLVTTYAALDLLGPAWTWKTTAFAEADPVEGKLGGNLYLKGSSDPKFAIVSASSGSSTPRRVSACSRRRRTLAWTSSSHFWSGTRLS